MCKACKKSYNAEYYSMTKDRHNPDRAERRKRVKEEARQGVYGYLRTHPCVDCGEDDIVVLDFDHQGEQVAGIADMIAAGARWEQIQTEINKCDVVCANDHRRRTAKVSGGGVR